MTDEDIKILEKYGWETEKCLILGPRDKYIITNIETRDKAVGVAAEIILERIIDIEKSIKLKQKSLNFINEFVLEANRKEFLFPAWIVKMVRDYEAQEK